MKREQYLKLIESIALVCGYFWYNANIHYVMVRVLS